MKYEVIGRGATVPSGCVLKLSEDQVRRRRLVLEEVKGKGWRVTAEGVSFKQGETFDLVEGHIDEKRGDLRRVGGKSPAEARAAKRAAGRKAAAAKRASEPPGAGGPGAGDTGGGAEGGSGEAQTGGGDAQQGAASPADLPLGDATKAR